MASLVLELQREALNTQGSVSHLLRMAFVVARKLGVAEFEKWVDAEMNGYKDAQQLPEYRLLSGSVKVFNPYYQGWQPLRFAEPKWAERLSKRPIFDPIAKLESMVAETSKSGEFMVTFVPQVERDLMDAMRGGPKMQPATAISGAAVQGVIDTVRNTVLDWSLRLETSGVLGEDMTFSDEEKRRMPEPPTPAPVAYYAQNQTVIHSMQQSQVQQATTDSTQTFVQAPPDLVAVSALMARLREQLDALNMPAEARGEVEADIATIEAQAKSPRPRFAIIRETMYSMRSVIEQAAGSVVGAGLLVEFTRLLS
ncbi:hypothetical protein LJR029_003292 [Caballeronia sp. LjRoot29]|uniref:AbiTii domain-containing protein n=1 Tax=Caballeronia sp. LjRoot29 TaxID=3342315 RepID=UPI003ECCB663